MYSLFDDCMMMIAQDMYPGRLVLGIYISSHYASGIYMSDDLKTFKDGKRVTIKLPRIFILSVIMNGDIRPHNPSVQKNICHCER